MKTIYPLFFLILVLFISTGFTQTPMVGTIDSVEQFPGTSFCSTTTITNASGGPGYSPYLQIIVPEGVTLDSATLFMTPVPTTNVGTFPASPGNQLEDPIIGTDVTGAEGSVLYILQPPIGSVVTGGIPLAIEICYTIDATAPVGTPISIGVTPVYELGDTATGDNGSLTGSPVNFNVTPILVEFLKEDNAPEAERPTGSSWPITYTLTANVANTNSLDNIVITDVLPTGFVLDPMVINVAGGVNCIVNSLISPINVTCDSVAGVGGGDIVVTYTGYFDDILDGANCTSTTGTNSASFDAEFNSAAIPTSNSDTTIQIEHLSIQKGNNTEFGSPGDTVTFTLRVQLSDFVDADSLVLTDILPDGFTFVPGSESSPTAGLGTITATDTVNIPNDGETTLVFDVTGLTAANIGGGEDIIIRYEATIDQAYFDVVPANGAPILASDVLTNTVTSSYSTTESAGNCTDGSSSNVTIQPVVVTKEIVSTGPYAPGGIVTYRMTMAIPSGDTNGIIFTDFFPLPVFKSSDIDVANFGTGFDIRLSPLNTLAGITPSSITNNNTTNSIAIAWPNVSTTTAQVLSIDIDAQITDDPFADGLNLTNLVEVRSENSSNTPATNVAPVGVVIQAPVLELTKGVLSASRGTIAPAASVLPVNGDVTGLDQGDTLTYRITLENTGGAPAHDIVITDVAIPQLTGCTATVTDGTGNPLAFSGSLPGSITLTNSLTENDDNPAGGGAPFSTDTALIDYSCTVGPVEIGSDFDNTASVTFTSFPSAINFPTLTDVANVTVLDPTIAKSILAVSPNVDNGDTDGTDNNNSTITIGETIQYQVTVTIPEGVVTNSVLTDRLDAGLVFQSFDSIVASPGLSTNHTGGFPGVLTDATGIGGRNASFPFDNLVNANTANGTAETLVITYTVLVTDVTANVDNLRLNNRARFEAINGLRVQANAPQRRIREPNIVLAKSANTLIVDAGDTVEYTIVVTNNGLSPAFNVSVVDMLADANLILVAQTIMVTGSNFTINSGDTAGDTIIDVDFSSIAIGASETITFDVLIGLTASSGSVLNNTAQSEYNSLPSGITGRDYGPVNGSTTVNVGSAAAAKTIVPNSTSEQTDGESALGDGSLVDLTIGELVTFEIVATLAEGVSPNVIISDVLPDSAGGQMHIVSASIENIGMNLTPTNAAPMPVIGPANTVSFDFGSVNNAPDGLNNADDQITVRVIAQVTNEAVNTGLEVLTNTALVQFSSGLNTSAQADIEVVEPKLSIDKSSTTSTADAGDVMTYTFTVENNTLAGSTATAFDVVMTDVLPADLLFAGNLSNTSGVVPTSLQENSGTVTITWDVFPFGTSSEITFDVTLSNNVTPEQVIQNTSEVNWTSLPGVDSEERTGIDSDSHSVTIGSAGLAKTVVSTSETSSGVTVNGPEDDVTIGERVTYQFTVDLPEGTIPNSVVLDQLPTSSTVMQVVSSRIVSIGSQLTLTASVGDAGVASDSDADTFNDLVTWNLGDIVNLADGNADAGDQIVFEVIAVLLDVPANQSGLSDIANQAELSFDGGLLQSTALIDVIEPTLNISKASNPSVIVADAGDVLNYQIIIEHDASSTADAFNTVITDILPDPGSSWINDTTVSSTCTGLVTNSSGDPSIVFTIPALSLSSGSCSINYQVVVDVGVMPDSTYQNTASMTYDSTEIFVLNETRRKTGSASSSFNTTVPALIKVTTDSSLNDTGLNIGNALLPDLAIGELVDFNITVVLPEGTTPNVMILDQLPLAASGAILEAVSGSVVSFGNNLSSTIPGTETLSNSDADAYDDQVSFDFGTVVNIADGIVDGNDQITVVVTARVVDDPLNEDLDTLVNTGTLTYDSGPDLSDTSSVEIVEPDLAIAKSMGAPVNGVVPISITLSNTGNAPAYDLTIIDILSDSIWDTSTITAVNIPNGFEFSTTAGLGETTVTINSDAAISAPLSSIEIGEVIVFEFNVKLIDFESLTSTTITNTTTLTEASSLPGVDNERDLSDEVAVDNLMIPLLDATKSVVIQVDNGAIGQVNPGDTLRYTIVISNSGNGIANNVILNDNPDANTALVVGSVTTSQGTVIFGNTASDTSVSIEVDNLAASASVTITYDVTVNNPFPSGVTEISNQGDILSDEQDPIQTDDPSTGPTDDPTVLPIGTSHDLVVTKDDAGFMASAGSTISYAINYSNLGDQNTTGVTITETVPLNTVYNPTANTDSWVCAPDNSSGSTCTLSIGNFNGGASGTAIFAIDVDNPLAAGITQISNSISINDDGLNGADANPSNNNDTDSTPVSAAPDMSVVKSDVQNLVVAGGTIIYNIEYDNVGTQDANGVVIMETVPVNTTYNMAMSSMGWSCANGAIAGTVCTFSVGIVNAADSAITIQFAVDVADPMPINVNQINNSVSIADDGSNGTDPDTSNNNDDEDTTIGAMHDLAISKDDGGITTTAAGDTVTYVINYGNIGNQNTTGVIITETIPANTTFSPANIDPWACLPDTAAGSTCTLSIGSLNGGVNAMASFSVVVDNPLPAGVSEILNTISIADDGTNGPELDTNNNMNNDNTPIDAAPDLVVTKTDVSNTVTAGGTIVYSIDYQNIGTQGATGVVITETIPANTTFNAVLSDPSWVCQPDITAGSLCTLNVGAVNAGSPITMVAFAIDVVSEIPAGVELIVNTVSIADDGTNGVDSDPSNNDDSEDTGLDAAPDLLITKTDVLNFVLAGGTIVYNIEYDNVGNQDATGVIITETVPTNTVFNSTMSDAGWACLPDGNSGSTCTINIGSVNASDSAQTIQFAVDVADPMPNGVNEISNSVSIADDGTNGVDPDLTNNDDDEDTNIGAIHDLTITKDDGGITSSAGGTVNYLISYGNIGNQNSTGIVITETVPANTVYDPAANTDAWICTPDNNPGSTCTLSIGDLDGGINGSVNFAVTIDNPKPAGVTFITNTASIADDGSNGTEAETGNNTDNDTTPIDAAPDLVITKTDVSDTVIPGGSIVFNITYQNIGTQDATGVVITETVPANTVFNVGSSDPNWTCLPDNTSGSICTFDVGNLGAGDAAQAVQFIVDVIAPSPAGVNQITNTVTIADDGTNGDDSNPSNNNDDEDTNVDAAPDLMITKTDGGVSAIAGGSISYTLEVSNIGNQDATGVTITETVPANTTFDPSSSDVNWTCSPDVTSGSTCTLLIGDLGVNDPAESVIFAVIISKPLPSGANAILNTANVSDDGTNGTDPDLTNNDGSDDTPVGAFPDLSIDKSDGGITSQAGGTIVYTLNYANTGNQSSSGVVITETVPLHTVFDPVASSVGWNCTPDNNPGSECLFTIANLDAGANGSIEFAVTVDDPLAPGVTEISNTVVITDDGTNGDDPNPDDNTSSDDTGVLLNPPVGVKIGEIDANNPLLIHWTFWWFNPNNAVDLPVFIYDDIPDNTEFAGNASCIAQGTSTCTTPVFNATLDRIELTAILGSDLNAPANSIPGALNNEIVIQFDTLISNGVFGNILISNQAEANWDENNNGDPNDDESLGQNPVVTDSPVIPGANDPTVVTTRIIHKIPTLNWWSMLILIMIMLSIGYQNRHRIIKA